MYSKFLVLSMALCQPLLARETTANPTALQEAADILSKHRYPLTLIDGKPGDRGGQLMLNRARQAQFVAIGESHYSKQTPQMVAALFEQLHQDGFNYLAIENGRMTTALFDQLLASSDPLAASRNVLSQFYGAYPFYDAVEEFQLLQAVAKVSTANKPLWGLDQEFANSWRYFLHRLATLAKDKEAQAYFEKLQEEAQACALQAARTMNQDLMFFDTRVDQALLAKLREYAERDQHPEMMDIVSELEKSTRIYQAKTAFEQNDSRLALFRENFNYNFKKEMARTGKPPKVLLKMGSMHSGRGRSRLNYYDIGNYLSELAQFYDGRSHHILMLAFVFESDKDIILTEDAPFYSHLLAGAATDKTWMVDFESARKELRQSHLKALGSEATNLLFSYDNLVMVPKLHTAKEIVPLQELITKLGINQ